jgi:succinoglycan biosynthesis transport protein ExoP
MDLKAYLHVLRERVLLVVLCMLVGIGAAAALAFTAAPRYSTSLELFVSTSQRGDVTDQYQGSLFTQQRVKSYAAVAASPVVLQMVIDELDLDTTVNTLQQKVTASAPLGTVLVTVTVEDGSALRSAQIADSIGRQFTKLISQIETPSGSARSPVKVSTIRPAELPLTPVAPDVPFILALGLLGGLGAGVAIALLAERLDTRVKTPEDATAAAAAPALGTVSQDADAARRPLVMQDEGWSPRGESYRQLRTAVRFVGVDRRLRSLVVTSAMPGDGKTTTAANLAISLAQAGQSVVLIDADLRRPRMTGLLGLDPTIGLTDVLVSDVPLTEALQQFADLPLFALASGPVPPNPSELLASDRMADVIAELTTQYDVVLFDTPPLLPVTDAAVLGAATDGAVIVARAGKTRREQLRHAADLLRGAGAPVLGLVVNGMPVKGGRYAKYAYRYSYETQTPRHGHTGGRRYSADADDLAHSR